MGDTPPVTGPGPVGTVWSVFRVLLLCLLVWRMFQTFWGDGSITTARFTQVAKYLGLAAAAFWITSDSGIDLLLALFTDTTASGELSPDQRTPADPLVPTVSRPGELADSLFADPDA